MLISPWYQNHEFLSLSLWFWHQKPLRSAYVRIAKLIEAKQPVAGFRDANPHRLTERASGSCVLGDEPPKPQWAR